MLYTVDFETTTDPKDCRVWAWGIMDIETYEFQYGNTIESLLEKVLKMGNNTFYFHNLKFDAQFLIAHLLINGWEHTTNLKVEKNQFSTVISDKNQFYQVKLGWKNSKGKNTHIIFQDSLKLIPYSVDKIAKDFKLPIQKEELDYETFREKGHILTEHEVEYLKHDVWIMALALQKFFQVGLTKMTIGANALSFYKKQFGQKNFDRHFPKVQFDKDIRQAYKGGWTFLKDEYASVDMPPGIVLDVNSLYPWTMHDCPMPFGEGKFFKGKYKNDELYPLYVQMVRVCFDIKPGYLPTIQLKGNYMFLPTQYVTTSNGEEITMCLTSVDLELFLDHYEIHWIEYLSGWKFRSSTKLFVDYIDYWMEQKIKAEKEGNMAMRAIAKLYLNNLYGKFAKHPVIASKIPILAIDGVVKYIQTKPEEKDGIYIPVAAFTTAWARNKTIRSAQAVYDRFIYADTDSLHLIGTEIPKGIEVDPYKLGAWKHESTFRRARFIRAKSYLEDTWNPKTNTWELKVTCAGMPKTGIPDVTWENFQTGFITGKNLKQKVVRGGAVLLPTTFEIKA